MKKSTLSALACLMGIGSLSAQSWIEKDLDFPTYFNPIQQISIVDSNYAWVLSGPGATNRKFTRTFDGGLTWHSSSLSSVAGLGNLVDIFALDSSTAYILSSSPTKLIKTTDSGVTWTQQGDSTFYGSPSSFADALYFWDSANGFVLGDVVDGHAEMYTTSDGGLNWIPVDTNFVPTSLIGTWVDYGPLSVVDSTIWFPSADGQVFKSTDRGQHWTATMVDSLGLWSIAFLDDGLHGLVQGSKLWATSDGGSTWDSVPPAGTLPGFVIRGIPGTSTFVSVTNNMSCMSTDFGYSWAVIDSGVHVYGGLEFYDNNMGFAGGKTELLLHGIYKWSEVTVGLSQPAESGHLNLFPNPGATWVTVQSEHEINSIIVHDMMGREVMQAKVGGTEARLDFTELQSGVYSVDVLTTKGLISRKYIKL